METAALDGSDRHVLLENQVGEACVTHTHAQVHCTDKKMVPTLILNPRYKTVQALTHLMNSTLLSLWSDSSRSTF